MNRKYFTLFFLAVCLTLSAKEYGYDEILKLIDTNNYSVKKVESVSKAMKEMVNGEGFDIMDTSFKYSLMDLDFNGKGFDPNMFTHQFSLMQVFPISAKLYFSRKAKELEYMNSLFEVRQKKIVIKKMVFEFIIELFKQERMLKNMLLENDAIKNLLEVSKTQYSTGKIILANVIEVELKLSESDNSIIETETMIKLLKNEISELLNITDDDFSFSINPESLTKIDLNQIDVNKLYQSFVKNNPDYNSAQNSISIFDAQYSAKAQSLIPDLGLGLDYKLKPNPTVDHFLGFDVELNIPLFSIVKKSSEMKYLLQKKEEMIFEKKELELNIKKNIERNIIELKSTAKQISLLNDRTLNLTDTTLNILSDAYKVDKVDIDMLLNTIIMNYDLKNKYFEYLVKFFRILLELEALSGEKYYNL